MADAPDSKWWVFSGETVPTVGTHRKGGKVLISACAGATGGVVFHQNGGKNPSEKSDEHRSDDY
jgi:hypothetical protein